MGAFAQPAALHAGSGNDFLPDPARSGAAPSGRRLASFPAATNGSAVQLAARLSPLLARLQFFRARVSASRLPFRVSFRSLLLFAFVGTSSIFQSPCLGLSVAFSCFLSLVTSFR